MTHLRQIMLEELRRQLSPTARLSGPAIRHEQPYPPDRYLLDKIADCHDSVSGDCAAVHAMLGIGFDVW